MYGIKEIFRVCNQLMVLRIAAKCFVLQLLKCSFVKDSGTDSVRFYVSLPL